MSDTNDESVVGLLTKSYCECSDPRCVGGPLTAISRGNEDGLKDLETLGWNAEELAVARANLGNEPKDITPDYQQIINAKYGSEPPRLIIVLGVGSPFEGSSIFPLFGTPSEWPAGFSQDPRRPII